MRRASPFVTVVVGVVDVTGEPDGDVVVGVVDVVVNFRRIVGGR